MDYDKLKNILMKWSMENCEYEMAYVLFTQFNTDIPVKLTYALPTRQMRTMNNLNDESKIIYDQRFVNAVKSSKYGRLKGGGYGYSFK
jgi:hypothetical protein